jgi:hypothetical protein
MRVVKNASRVDVNSPAVELAARATGAIAMGRMRCCTIRPRAIETVRTRGNAVSAQNA